MAIISLYFVGADPLTTPIKKKIKNYILMIHDKYEFSFRLCYIVVARMAFLF